MACRVKERPRLRSSRGSQEVPEKPRHAPCCMKEEGGISGSTGTEKRGEISPLQRETGVENTLANGQDYRSRRGRGGGKILGDSRKGKERGRTGRKEELLKKSPGEKQGKQGRTAGVAAPRAPKRALSTSLSLSLPQCQYQASQACMPSYASTGTGGHDGRPPAGSGGRMLHSLRAASPPLFLPTCHPLQWAEPGTLLGHIAT